MSDYVVLRLSKSELALITNALSKYADKLYEKDPEAAKPYIMLLQRLQQNQR